MAAQAGPSGVGRATDHKDPSVPGDEPFVGVTRDNGVSFKALDNVSIESYLQKFHECMPDKRVAFASRISNNRIALYLDSKADVADAAATGLPFGDSFLELTPLVRPTTRLTLSNVYPEVPNAVLLHTSDFAM